eukprot:tig00000367_g24457.t1
MPFEIDILRRVSNGDVAKSGSVSLAGVKGRWVEVPMRPGPNGIDVTLVTLRRYLIVLKPVPGQEETFTSDLAAIENRSLTITLEYWDDTAAVSDAKPLLVFESPSSSGQPVDKSDWRRYKGQAQASVTLRFSRRGDASESFGIRATSHQHQDRRFRLRMRWDDSGEDLSPHAPLCVFSRSKRFSRAKQSSGAKGSGGEEGESGEEEPMPPAGPPIGALPRPLPPPPALNSKTLASAALPPGAHPPGALPPGALPPGALPPGALPPGAFPQTLSAGALPRIGEMLANGLAARGGASLLPPVLAGLGHGPVPLVALTVGSVPYAAVLQQQPEHPGPFPVYPLRPPPVPGAAPSPGPSDGAADGQPAAKRARGGHAAGLPAALPLPPPLPNQPRSAEGSYFGNVSPLLPEFREWIGGLSSPSSQSTQQALVQTEQLLANIEALKVPESGGTPGAGPVDRDIRGAEELLTLYRPLSIPSGIRGAAALSARVQRGLPVSSLRIADESLRAGVLPLVRNLLGRGLDWLRRGGPRGADAEAGLRDWRQARGGPLWLWALQPALTPLPQLVEVLSDPRVLDTPLYATRAGRCLAFRAVAGIRSVSRSHSVACSVAWTLVDALTHLADGPKTLEESRWICRACWSVAEAYSDVNIISSPDLFLIGTDDLDLVLDRALAVARAAAQRDPELLATALYWRARGCRHLRRDEDAEAALEEALSVVARHGIAPSRTESAVLRELYDVAWTLRRPPAVVRAIADRLYWFTEEEEDRLQEAMTCVTLVKCAPVDASRSDILFEANRARDIVKALSPEYGHCYMLNVLLNIFSIHIFNRSYTEALAVYREWVDFCASDPSRVASPNADWANFLRPVWARSYRVSEFYRLARLLITLHRAVDPEDRCPVLPHLLFVYGDILLFDEQPAAAASALSQSLSLYEQKFGDFFPPDSPRIRAVSRSLERALARCSATPPSTSSPASTVPAPNSNGPHSDSHAPHLAVVT